MAQRLRFSRRLTFLASLTILAAAVGVANVVIVVVTVVSASSIGPFDLIWLQSAQAVIFCALSIVAGLAWRRELRKSRQASGN